jgi:hypothetical protein
MLDTGCLFMMCKPLRTYFYILWTKIPLFSPWSKLLLFSLMHCPMVAFEFQNIIRPSNKHWTFLIFSNENAMKKFSDDGIPTKRSPLEVSESSDVVITMLPSSAHVSWLHDEVTIPNHDMKSTVYPIWSRTINWLLFKGMHWCTSTNVKEIGNR